MRWWPTFLIAGLLVALATGLSWADEFDDLAPELKPTTGQESREYEALRAAYVAMMACGDPQPDTDAVLYASCLVRTEGDVRDARRRLASISRRSRYRVVKQQLLKVITDHLADMPRVRAWLAAAGDRGPHDDGAPSTVTTPAAPLAGTPRASRAGATTGRPKTVIVRPYFRTDGTYVPGHRRSAPRR